MKIELTEGCIAWSLTIDGEEEINLTDEARIKVYQKIFEWLKDKPDQLNTILQRLVPYLAQNYETTDEPCECCGDYVDTYTWEI